MPSSGQRICDAVVIGAGPAGAAAARRLRNRGASVLVLERQSLPRYKACGGGVPARTIRLLDDQDISRFGQHQFRKTSKHPLAWMLMRDRFDQSPADLRSADPALTYTRSFNRAIQPELNAARTLSGHA